MKDADFNIVDDLKEPPFVKTTVNPQDIVGSYASLLKTHIEKIWKCNTTEEHERAVSKISEDQRVWIAELYKGLRDNGYYICGLDANRRIKIGIVTDRLHKVNANLDPVPDKITKEMVTAFIRKLETRTFKSMPRPTKEDYAKARLSQRGM